MAEWKKPENAEEYTAMLKHGICGECGSQLERGFGVELRYMEEVGMIQSYYSCIRCPNCQSEFSDEEIDDWLTRGWPLPNKT